MNGYKLIIKLILKISDFLSIFNEKLSKNDYFFEVFLIYYNELILAIHFKLNQSTVHSVYNNNFILYYKECL